MTTRAALLTLFRSCTGGKTTIRQTTSDEKSSTLNRVLGYWPDRSGGFIEQTT